MHGQTTTKRVNVISFWLKGYFEIEIVVFFTHTPRLPTHTAALSPGGRTCRESCESCSRQKTRQQCLCNSYRVVYAICHIVPPPIQCCFCSVLFCRLHCAAIERFEWSAHVSSHQWVKASGFGWAWVNTSGFFGQGHRETSGELENTLQQIRHNSGLSLYIYANYTRHLTGR